MRRASHPSRRAAEGTVPDMDDMRDVYDAEDHRDKGNEYQDDEERERE